ncbi:LysR family transcriptional regulator [Omnitrophica bacterium]|nr:LysR family transcriptional regulator [Candidatus Omnitrophota bacterium]
MIPLNYHHLYYFYVIAEEGSVTGAAQKLRLAQSSLSMQLGQFEDFLEKKLFVREGKKLLLTEDGHYILSYAKAIFDLGDELSDSLGDRGRKEQLRIQIGVSSFIPKSFVDNIINGLFEQPETPYIYIVEKHADEMIADLAVHKLDMVLNDLSHQAPVEQGIQNHVLARIPIVLCANKRLAKTIRKIPQDLNHAPMILPTSQSQTYHALQEYFLTHKIKPKIIAEIQDIELVRRLALSGKGVAPLNEFTVLNAPAKERLTILGKERSQFPIHDTIYLICKKRKHPHPLVTQMIKQFKLPQG